MEPTVIPHAILRIKIRQFNADIICGRPPRAKSDYDLSHFEHKSAHPLLLPWGTFIQRVLVFELGACVGQTDRWSAA